MPSLSADPAGLAACHLDDFAAAWAARFRIPAATFARADGEHDGLYRPRLVAMIADRRGRLPLGLAETYHRDRLLEHA